MVNVRLQVNEEKLQVWLQTIFQSALVYRPNPLLQLEWGVCLNKRIGGCFKSPSYTGYHLEAEALEHCVNVFAETQAPLLGTDFNTFINRLFPLCF